MSATSPTQHTLHAIAAGIRNGQWSAVSVLNAFTQCIDSDNPALNAVIAEDRDQALATAQAADAALQAGRLLGPLHGVPMTIKDGFETAGLHSASGSPALASHNPDRHADAVQRLADAGAVIMGKTNVPMFCADFQTDNPLYGRTNNPWDTNRSPGGSSGGAAAALAAGLTPAELGSDIGGSIRNPAHFCGVYGHKPTFGRISMRGHIPGPPGTLSPADMTVCGPMARSADDLRLVFDVLDPTPDAGGAPPDPSHMRVRLWLDDETTPIDARMAEVYRSVAGALRGHGMAVDEAAPPIGLERIYPLYMKLLAAAVGGGLPNKLYKRMKWAGRLGRLTGRTAPDSLAGYAGAATMSHRDWLKCNEQRYRLQARMDRLFEDHDIILMPVTPTPAITHQPGGTLFTRRIQVNGEERPYADHMAWVSPATIGNLPATVAPAGLVDGLPVGLQIMAARGRDRDAIAFAQHLATIVPPPLQGPDDTLKAPTPAS